MKNSKKLFILIVLILIVVLLFRILQTYAKYLSIAYGTANVSVAEWNILVNNVSIRSSTNISSTIVPVFPGTEHISSGIIAPTAEGYFDLNIDFTDADVSFSYTINTSVSATSPVQDLVTTGYSVDGGSKINFATYNSPITETILLNNVSTTRSIRIYVLWNDNPATQTMSNEDDAESTTSLTPVTLNVTISFTQVQDSPSQMQNNST